MTDSLLIEPIDGSLDADVRVPGSKSLTNRALLLAALADGTSSLRGALLADDTRAMASALVALGADVDLDEVETTVRGFAGRPRSGPVTIDAQLSGTTARFVLPVLMLGEGPYVLDGQGSLRERPMGPTIEALAQLGIEVDDSDNPGHLPVVVHGGEVHGDGLRVDAALSSQFTSGLLLVGPLLPRGMTIDLVGPVVSRPYLDMTIAVLEAFGADASSDGARRFHVGRGGLRATDYAVEPDASAASYFFAAAAVCGGRVAVEGIGSSSLQGDIRFVDLLAQMGASIDQTPTSTEVRGGPGLSGIDVDLSDMPDMAQTLAAVAVFAESPTRVRGVEVIRGHETDRISAVVSELRRCGIDADEHRDGFTVHPGTPRPAIIETYHDHRMAMSFSLLGLRAAGIEIRDPACVSKTFPSFFATLDQLRMPSSSSGN